MPLQAAGLEFTDTSIWTIRDCDQLVSTACQERKINQAL